MLQLISDEEQSCVRGNPLKGKRVLIPPMAQGSARLFAAGFRALGVEADVTPPSDHLTLEIGSRYTCGDECYPAKVTVGDFIKALEQPNTEPARTVLFMPTADGPCRFGQYAPYLRRILDSAGYGGVEVLSPTSANGYAGLGDLARPFFRTGWRTLVAGDILHKALLKRRPHEIRSGEADRAYETSLNDLCTTVEQSPVEPAAQLVAIRDALIRALHRFRAVETYRDRSKPLLGVVGEIFCRLNTFSNDDLIRRLEDYGAEAWLSDISEWIWYANSEQFRKLKLQGKSWSVDTAKAWLRNRVQSRDEHVLLEPFKEEFRGYEEPHIAEILEAAEPYLPSTGALGEMVLNIGKAVCLSRKGLDGIIDISPFTCMNGIVSEAIYPRLSRDLGGIPIRSFYFDGTQSDLDRDLGVYLELAQTFRKKKALPA
jgi:predicted nucleotide-binding protein (sugar kinase/HSP70/actin superfamily)